MILTELPDYLHMANISSVLFCNTENSKLNGKNCPNPNPTLGYIWQSHSLTQTMGPYLEFLTIPKAKLFRKVLPAKICVDLKL